MAFGQSVPTMILSGFSGPRWLLIVANGEPGRVHVGGRRRPAALLLRRARLSAAALTLALRLKTGHPPAPLLNVQLW